MTAHKTKEITIKTAHIDEDMIPLVDWLNSFDDVTTLFCCQGDEEDERFPPYVRFQVGWFELYPDTKSANTIASIIDAINQAENRCFQCEGVRKEIDWHVSRGFTFTLRFPNRKVLSQTTEYLVNKWPLAQQ